MGRPARRSAGISGRSHGLDRAYFAAVDSEAFRQHPGFKVFQFHAAVQEYLPPHLRDHIQGISRQDLPGGCDYYAGGHIHYTYTGVGPEGGLLVNPGAVFGTSVTDLENGAAGKTEQGVVIVTVTDGVPHPEFVTTAPRANISVFDVDVAGRTASEAKELVARELHAHAAPGALLFPRLRGTLSEGTVGGLGLPESRRDAGEAGVRSVHWDLSEAGAASGPDTSVPGDEAEIVRGALSGMARAAAEHLPALEGPDGARRLEELLRELGTPRGEGESKNDYETARVASALKILGVPPPSR